MNQKIQKWAMVLAAGALVLLLVFGGDWLFASPERAQTPQEGVQAAQVSPSEQNPQQVVFYNAEGEPGVPLDVTAQEAQITVYRPEDLQKLAVLTELRDLELKFVGLAPEEVTLEPLRGMAKLEELEATDCQIQDLSPLAGLKELRVLTLYYNDIADLTPLIGLTKLEELRLQSNQISDVSPLQGLINLSLLALDENPISDLSPLHSLPEATMLSLSNVDVLWNGWQPVAHIKRVNGMPPSLNAGETPCPAGWVSRMEAAYPGNQIKALDYDDYDGDGSPEAFALLNGPASENNAYPVNRLLFVTDAGIDELGVSGDAMYISGYFRFGATKIIKVENVVAMSSSVSLLWTADQGHAQEMNLSGWGQGFQLDELGNVCLLHSTYDASSDGSGHTYKPYYFYFDGSEFIEYGAIEIDRQRLLTCPGAKEILSEAESDRWAVEQILYRGNDLIHLNLRRSDENVAPNEERVYANRYLTLRIEENSLSVWQQESGFYLPSLMDSFGTQNTVRVQYPATFNLK